MQEGLAMSTLFCIFTYNKEIKVMKNETKQSSIEWLAEQFDNIVELYPSQFEKINNAIEQAKEMHKQEIIDAWEDGQGSFPTRNEEQYYNETFKK
jgi:hypothetical protein